MSDNKFGKEYFDNATSKVDSTTSFYEEVNWFAIAADMCTKHREITGFPIDSFFDVGCAKGFLVKAFQDMGIKHSTGIDISEYAITNAAKGLSENSISQCEVKDIIFTGRIDLLSAYSVLHYLPEQEVTDFIYKCTQKVKVLHIGQFPLDDSPATKKYWKKLDEHTQLFKPLSWWINLIVNAGFNLVSFELIDAENPAASEASCYFLNINI